MRDRLPLVVLAAAMAAGLVVFLLNPQPKASPADKAAFEKIVEQALDSNSPQRFELWRAAGQQVARVDPNRPTSASSFVRSGLFHWYELNDADRKSVLAAIEPSLHDEAFFGRMAEPLFHLTGDFKLLRRANPGTESAISFLASMAVTNGRFADYRLFREQLRKERFVTFQLSKSSASPAELVALVPVPATTADTALLKGILETLHVRPIDNGKLDSRRTDTLIEFALDHDLQPIDGLDALVHLTGAAGDPQRARLALRLEQFDRAAGIESASTVTDRAQWRTYVLERAVAEMRRHEPLAAMEYLKKADDVKSPDVIAATEEIQRIAGDNPGAAAIHATLAENANKVGQWSSRCGNDVCDHASGVLWSNGTSYVLKLTTVQSDEVPPYAEIYVDDALRDEGAVSPALLTSAELLAGIHRIDVRLANPMTRNAVRRRVRIE